MISILYNVIVNKFFKEDFPMSTHTLRNIDIVHINENGTVDILDLADSYFEYPHTWQYKLYNTFEENVLSMLSILYQENSLPYSFTKRFKDYLDERQSLYSEVVAKYLPIVSAICNSDFSEYLKKSMLNEIDFELNRLYPYRGTI